MNIITFSLNLIALTFVSWEQPLFSYVMRCSDNNHPWVRNNQIGKKVQRILEAESKNPFEECGQLFGQDDEEMDNYVHIITTYPVNIVENEELETNQMNNNFVGLEMDDLYSKISQLWNDSVENMVNEYITYTDSKHMEVPWRDEMWNQRWYRYLDTIHAELNRVLYDDALSLETRENICEDLLLGTANDFKWFLNIVKDEWEKIHPPQVIFTEV
ncbi:Plasmodium exported protein, unknown function [Plasmodium gonderi]|uniref:Variable surface protein n=1 Tax=Plasmodium gonderi TaxID=77519 RepID=A0A1Y1JBL1_PLAGO|nr:Plasmodium exported protein, unknown function [Plasmodium gonderi]GAW79058.1 Plasmodium exported protein, unknown function [Plasmodium gonderi]